MRIVETSSKGNADSALYTLVTASFHSATGRSGRTLYPRRRKELATTERELSAIAAAANSGRRNPSAATGIPTEL